MKRTRAVLVALACAAALASCSDAEADHPVEEGTGPLTVEVGEEFSWNGFRVEDGWTLEPVERDVGVQETQVTPEVKGSVVNEGEADRAVIFEMAFVRGGSPLATVNCSAQKLAEDQSAAFECPGFGQNMPSDYDEVVVQEITR